MWTSYLPRSAYVAPASKPIRGGTSAFNPPTTTLFKTMNSPNAVEYHTRYQVPGTQKQIAVVGMLLLYIS